jgi:hypothetical protein
MSTNDPSRHDDARPDDTLHDDVFADGTHDPDSTSRTQVRETTALPVTPSAPGAGTATATTSAPVATAAPGATASGSTASEDEPWLRGPAPFAIVLGLLGLLVAGATLVTELTDVSFPWADLGPWTVVAAGLVVVLVGAIGLRSSRRTQD